MVYGTMGGEGQPQTQSAAFASPPMVDHHHHLASPLLDDALGHGGPVEIVEEVAAPLPAEMIGLAPVP